MQLVPLVVMFLFFMIYIVAPLIDWLNEQPPPVLEFSSVLYYSEMFRGWPFWLGVGLLFLFMLSISIFPSFFEEEKT